MGTCSSPVLRASWCAPSPVSTTSLLRLLEQPQTNSRPSTLARLAQDCAASTSTRNNRTLPNSPLEKLPMTVSNPKPEALQRQSAVIQSTGLSTLTGLTRSEEHTSELQS